MASFFPEHSGVEAVVHNRQGKVFISRKEMSLEHFEQLSSLMNGRARPAPMRPELRS